MGEPSEDARYWFARLARAGSAIGEMAAGMTAADRRREVGRGAGGDVTVLIDGRAEDIIVAELESTGRGLRLVSEELGERILGGGGSCVVVVDPIDGSLNAKRGLPTFATSIAVAEGPRMTDVVLAYLRDHSTGEEMTAERGVGAWLDGRPVPRVAGGGVLELVALEGASPGRLVGAAAALGDVHRVRVLGSIALSLAGVGLGRVDGLLGLIPSRAVDVAAAQLIVREAGGVVGMPGPDDLATAPLDVDSRRHVIAARDHEALARLWLTLDAAGG